MRSVIPYSLAFVGIILTTSLAVLGQGDDPCLLKTTCQDCVSTKTNTSVTKSCVFAETGTGPKCVSNATIGEGVSYIATDIKGCGSIPTPAPTPPSNTSTTTPVPTPITNATTTAPPTPPTPAPTTNGTTTSTVAPSTNGTTTTTAAPSTNGTTTVTPAPGPTNGTTTVKPTPGPTPTPRKGGFAWGEFIGGIVFAVALSSVAYLIWRFYKARLDRNYHTFSNPTF